MTAPVKYYSEIDLFDLYAKARDANSNAFCPNSKCRVGAALLARTGKPGEHEYLRETFVGAKAEGSSESEPQCAEGAALGSAIAKGHRIFDVLVLASPDGTAIPCKKCREILHTVKTKPYVVTLDKDGRIVRQGYDVQ